MLDLDIGDTHVAVPWDRVRVAKNLEEVNLPVTEDNVEEFSIFGAWGYVTKQTAAHTQQVEEEFWTGPRVWKASDILNEYAVLTGGKAFAYVDDLVFTPEGSLHAVVVHPDRAALPGPLALPYYSYGWAPGAPIYKTRYGSEDLTAIKTFDTERLKGGDSTGRAAAEPLNQKPASE